MNNGIELAQEKFFAGIGRISDAFGLNRFVAQLYALLYFHGEPMSLEDIAVALGVSKGNVSINIRELESWGAVKSVWIKGSRKDYYQAETNLKKVFLNKINSSIHKRGMELGVMVEDFEKSLVSLSGVKNKDDARRIARYRQKLKEIKKVRAMAINAVKLLSKFTY